MMFRQAQEYYLKLPRNCHNCSHLSGELNSLQTINATNTVHHIPFLANTSTISRTHPLFHPFHKDFHSKRICLAFAVIKFVIVVRMPLVLFTSLKHFFLALFPFLSRSLPIFPPFCPYLPISRSPSLSPSSVCVALSASLCPHHPSFNPSSLHRQPL